MSGDFYDSCISTSWILLEKTAWSADAGSFGASQRNNTTAVMAPANCVTTKAGASTVRMPAKVLVNVRARVTAGLANEVEAVNQYAAVIKAPTAKGVAAACAREQPTIT